MSIIRINERKLRPVVFVATGLFLVLAVLYFLPVRIPHKISFPLATLFAASLWLCPWQMAMAMLFSGLGDYMGSCGDFIGQMAFFALAHVWMIIFFIQRYFTKVERDRKLTGKAKGYLTMIGICIAALLVIIFTRVVPCTPEGIIRIGVGIYACVISTMLLTAMLQRSSLYALGAILFVFSDFILAWNKFVEPIEYKRYLIMVPYYLGQWLLFIRSTPYRVAPEMRILRF